MFCKDTNVRITENIRDDTNVHTDTNKKNDNKFLKKNFVLTQREVKKKADDENLEILTLTGIASSLSEDLVGESMTENALKSMMGSAIGLPVFYDHMSYSDMAVGVITNSYIEDDLLYIDFNVLPSQQPQIREYLDNGMPLSLSIGGHIPAGGYLAKEDKINEINLLEISLTFIPCNRDSLGSVHVKENSIEASCIGGVCKSVLGQMEVNKMENNNNKMLDENQLKTFAKAIVDEVMAKAKADDNGNVGGESDDSNSEPATIQDVKDMLAEFKAELEDSITEIVEEKVNELLDDKDESKASGKGDDESNDSEDDDENDDDKNKSIDIDSITEKVKKDLFKDLKDSRDYVETKTDKHMDKDTGTDSTTNTGKATSEEIAKSIITNNRKSNPLMQAVMAGLQRGE
jgi:hypothetical protein